MSDYKDFIDNQEVAEKRQGALGESGDSVERKEIEAPLKDQIPQALRRVLVEQDIGMKITDMWNQANGLRQDNLDRQKKLRRQVEEFVEPIYNRPEKWMSTLHLPMPYIVCKAFHARMFSAIMGQDPPFQVRAQKEANTDRAPMIQDLMNYTIKRWANHNDGIDDAMDQWLWDWVTTGRGIMKQRWVKDYTRFVEVQDELVEGVGREIAPGEFVPTVTTKQKPVKVDRKVFDGPVWENVNDEDVVIIGGNGDPDKADFVCEQTYFTMAELYSLADQKIFDKQAVQEILEESSPDRKSEEPANDIKNEQAETAGEGSVDDQEVIDRYQFLEAYLKVDVDNSGLCQDVVVHVHAKTGLIVRAAYLYNVMKTGRRPYSVIDFHKRKGQQTAVGLVELIYPLAKEMDAMHNMKVDFGMLSTLPIGFYRASSSLQKERIPLTPGNLIPLDDPQRDVNFPQMGNRSVFAAQEEQALFNIISRVTGLSDLNFGAIGAQGVTRTATGTSALVQESNANLDIFLRRANRGFKKLLIYQFQMLQEKLPPGFEFRITGEDGNQYFRQIPTRQELAGMVDFEIEPNSANSNQQVKIQAASQALQLTQNPLLIQLGIVTPQNVYEAAKAFMQASGIRDWSRYITPPPQGSRHFTPEEITNRILAGVEVLLTPDQDLQGFLAFAENIINDDDLLGQFDEQQTIMLAQKMQEAQQMLEALRQIEAQQANSAQIQRNAALSTPGGGPRDVGNQGETNGVG